MESERLARANIKITHVTDLGEEYAICYEYQWRDKNHNARWAGDVTTIPKVMTPGNEEPHDTTPDDMRAWVYIDVQETREKLED